MLGQAGLDKLILLISTRPAQHTSTLCHGDGVANPNRFEQSAGRVNDLDAFVRPQLDEIVIPVDLYDLSDYPTLRPLAGTPMKNRQESRFVPAESGIGDPLIRLL